MANQRGIGASDAAVMVHLTDRECQVVLAFASGHHVADVAEDLGIGRESVRTYLRRARARYVAAGLRASTRRELRALVERRIGL